MKKFNQIKNSIRWNLFFKLGLIIFVCQLITVFLLWHESKEQIDILVNAILSAKQAKTKIFHEELEAILILLSSTFIIMSFMLFLVYRTIKKITLPLESIQSDLSLRTADNLNPIYSKSSINEIKSITKTLNNLFERLNDTLVQERLFTADVAHELRTPLAGIRLHLELLEMNHNIPCSELIERIDRLVNTIEQLLTLARASQKFIIGQAKLIDFENDIQKKLNNELNEMLMVKNQKLFWDLLGSSNNFNGDPTLICLLIRNLVENSFRYSPVESNIIIKFYQNEQRQTILEVQDEGCGIDDKKISQLTQAFFRMDQRHKGIGLGLSIVQRIIKLHQGQLVIENRNDGQQGTIVKCFFYTH